MLPVYQDMLYEDHQIEELLETENKKKSSSSQFIQQFSRRSPIRK